ncbi:helix-turn-helix domain-containing protein [Mesorhizobium sp. M4B.F.Ca.ET.019.03.1.1]|uniref:helix-turn-helix domain-containing protein n=1 Tax=Mesorhizobium sp. M4B.F.Ca.ET.019.03.1.1 TaxID=2496651 RepID=UPI00167D8678|nr:helix-turn-helix domain-containing protein [Mesorhizobium sp. M4B.F.Ca.ET.019.03.1.1]
MSKLAKGTFYCLPNAARRDARLTGTDHRVLGAITFFDRGGANGRGCFATQTTLATEAACDVRAVKRSIQRLVEFGILLVAKSPEDARRNTLHVVYEDELGDNPAPYSTPQKGAILSPNTPEIGDNGFGDIVENQGHAQHKEIRLNLEGNAVETAAPSGPSKGNAVETAPKSFGHSAHSENLPSRNADDVMALGILSMGDDAPFLAKLDREIQSGRLFGRDIAEMIYQRLESIHDEGHQVGDPIAGRAYRLLQTDFCRDGSCYDEDGAPTWRRS